MKLVCLGLNHKSAPVEVRERFAVSNKKLGTAAAELCALEGVGESVVVSTCNRTEYYFTANAPQDGIQTLIQHLKEKLELLDEHLDHLYSFSLKDVATHLGKVISGLDSMVLGETEIAGQIKDAYRAAQEAKTTGKATNQLFQNAFRVGKSIRTQTKIQSGSTSVGNVAVDLAAKIFGKLESSKVMLIGAGEICRVVAQSLLSRGAKSVFVTNRSYDKALELADKLNGEAVRFDDWQTVIEKADIVISSTGAPYSIIKKEALARVRRKRKYRPLFMIDIAVPRDIDPDIAEFEEVYLYDIDSIEQIANSAREKRIEQIEECMTLIEAELKDAKIEGTE